MYRIYLTFAVIVMFLNTSCAGLKQKKWLTHHQSQLAALAGGNASPEEKLDGLFTAYVQLMSEGLRFGNPVKGAKYIETFQKQNQGSIDSILRDAEKWRGGLNLQQGIELGLSVPKKPYARQFIEMAPKFKRKYQQYKFVADMTSKVGGGFGRTVGKILSL
jgi:hypothetical protein